MEKRTIKMVAEKATKNQIRFKENTVDGQPPVLDTMYIPKWVVGEQETIDVTIEPAADSATTPKK